MKPVSLLMGSSSDWEIMSLAASVLDSFGVEYDKRITSAHRTPEAMASYGKSAQKNGTKVIIAGAGGAAHLPGMLASFTNLPVIGVPIKSHNSIQGIDSLLSIVQMPKGVPVATVAINGSENAAILAIQILSLNDDMLATKLEAYKKEMQQKVEKDNKSFL